MFLVSLTLLGKLIILRDTCCKGTEFQTRVVERSCEMDATPRIVHFLVFVSS